MSQNGRVKLINKILITLMALVFGAATSWGAVQTADTVTILKAENLSCGSCAVRIKKALESEPGVTSVEVDIDAGKVTVSHDGKAIQAARVASVVTDAGYPSTVVKTAAKDGSEKEVAKAGDVKKSMGVGCSCCNKN